MFYHLPPVGNKVWTSVEAGTALPAFLSEECTQFYASGTAALAAAITAAMKQKNKSVSEVILPAYACPDLVSAVLHAGAKPVLVDIEHERPWFDFSQLSLAITDNTVAIVGVNLFGISERWEKLHELAKQNDIVLIEDSAQYFPANGEVQSWQGDLVVLSFGRGKPVSLLGGGAVFSRREGLFALLPRVTPSPITLMQRFLYNVKAQLYNYMISPRLYWLPAALPFLHLGETRYHPLPEIAAIDQQRMELLAGNIHRYQLDKKALSNAEKISLMLESVAGIVNLPRVCNMQENHRLLRYPLLLQSNVRNQVYRKLEQAGLGASVMYPASLSAIDGVNDVLDDPVKYNNAEALASQILTLPLHVGVSEKDIQNMKVILMELD